MDLIPYREFAKMRLQQFYDVDIASTKLPDWEWMGGFWYCDAIGFTWFGRLHNMPNETGGLEIDILELPEHTSSRILAHLCLPLRAAMSYDAITAILGEPVRTLSFVADRKTYEFRIGSSQPYRVSCTVHDDAGLVFVSVIREDVLSRIETA